jgi:hypothetical protein
MIPISSLRNCRMVDANFGELFLSDEGEKFFVGRAGNGEVVAVIIEGDFGQQQPFFFSPVASWTRHGVVVPKPVITVDSASLAKPDSVPPGSISLSQGTVHISCFSGQSYEPVAVSGDGRPTDDAIAFLKWSITTEGTDGNSVALFSFGAG